jgi:hypothetical protein
MKHWFAVAVVAPLALLVAAAFPDTLSVAVGPAVTITGSFEGQAISRAVLAIPIPTEVLQSHVDFAILCFPAFSVTNETAVVGIEACPLTTAWDAGSVSWTGPWRNPGGDFDSTTPATYAIAAGDSNQVTLDITEYVLAWQNGTANCGVILTRSQAEGGGFGTEVGNLGAAVAAARLKLYYHHVQR